MLLMLISFHTNMIKLYEVVVWRVKRTGSSIMGKNSSECLGRSACRSLASFGAATVGRLELLVPTCRTQWIPVEMTRMTELGRIPPWTNEEPGGWQTPHRLPCRRRAAVGSERGGAEVEWPGFRPDVKRKGIYMGSGWASLGRSNMTNTPEPPHICP